MPKLDFAGSPRTPKRVAKEPVGDVATWTAQAQSQLRSARELRQQAQLCLTGGSSSSRSGPSSTRLGSSAIIRTTVVAAVARDKWKKQSEISKDVMKAVQGLLESTHSEIRRTREVIHDLQRASGARFAALSIAEKRMELRQKRPPSECVDDLFTQALEQEREKLLRIREQLSAKVEVGQGTFERLEQLHLELNGCRHTLHMDRTSRPREFLGDVRSAEDAAARFRLEAVELMEVTQRQADRAVAHTVVCMKRRISELVGMRRALEGEIRQMSCTIDETKSHLDAIRSKISICESAPERVLEEDPHEDLEDGLLLGSSSRRLQKRSAMFAGLRAKIKAASYTGHSGRQLDVLFARFDKNGSGDLDVDELRRALRRTLKIPPSSVPDAEIAHLYSVLDDDNSGSVSIAEIVKFLGAEYDLQDLHAKREAAEALLAQLHAAMQELVEDLRRKTAAWQSDESCVTVTAVKALELDTLPPAGSAREVQGRDVLRRLRSQQTLSPEALDKVRVKLKSAAYTGHAGCQLEVLFSRFDKDGSGQLEDAEVHKALRNTLMIPDSVIANSEISALCAALDPDGSGAVSISELITFVGPEPVVSQRTGKPMAGVTPAPVSKDDARGATLPGGHDDVSTPGEERLDTSGQGHSTAASVKPTGNSDRRLQQKHTRRRRACGNGSGSGSDSDRGRRQRQRQPVQCAS